MSVRNITIGAIAVLCGSRVEAQAPVPVHAEPRHRMVWEAGSIRVLDVQVPPGDRVVGMISAVDLGTEVDNIAARALYESVGTMPEDFVLYSFDLTRTP